LVEIVPRGLKEIIIFEHVRYPSAEDLARVAILETGGFQPPVLRWARGLAFRIAPSPLLLASDYAAREFAENGRMHVSIDFAEMSQYKSSVNAAEEKVVVPVLDESPSEVSRRIVEWLKTVKD
jgi:hypothetical protein